MAVWRARREKVDPDAVYELATWLFLGGVIGARLFFFIQHPEAYHNPGDLFRTWEGGNVFYGCILGGLTGSILYWFRRPFPFLSDVRRNRARGRHRRRGGTHRLLPEWLLPRRGLRAAVGRPLPRRQPCLGTPAQRGAAAARRCALAARASHAALFGRGGIHGARRAVDLRPTGPASGRADGRPDDRLPADPLADRGDP